MKIKKFFITLFILILIIYTMPISFASVNESDLDITSEAALLIDNNTGKILYGKNENEKKYPASITKNINCNFNN